MGTRTVLGQVWRRREKPAAGAVYVFEGEESQTTRTGKVRRRIKRVRCE